MALFYITDENARENHLTFVEAVECIADWYSYLQDDAPDDVDVGIQAVIDSVEEPDEDDYYYHTDAERLAVLQSYADEICEKLAEALGYSDFAGHGNYAVSAACQAGFRLTVQIHEGDDADDGDDVNDAD